MIRWNKAAIVAVVGAHALTGCAGGGTGSGGSSSTLTLGTTQLPSTFDPSGAGWGNVAPFVQTVYDTLIHETADKKLEPFLAKSWTYDETNTVLTLTLRDDVTFSDGSKLTADVVKKNLERFKVGSNGPSNLGAVATIEAPDATTVVLKLSAQDPSLLGNLSRDPGGIASGQAISDPDSLKTKPVGSGPYILDAGATVTGTSYVYTRNPNYWDPAKQHYDKIVIKYLADQTAALNAVKAGEVNGLKLVNNTDVAQVEQAGFTTSAKDFDFQGLLLLDRAGTMNKALGDVRVRQAINMAFDRKALLNALQAGKGKVTEQVFAPNSQAFDAKLDETYPYDPAKAKKLLADAGYADGFTLDIPTTPAFSPALYTLISQQLGEIGVKVKLTDAGTKYASDILAPKYAAAYMSLGTGYDWEYVTGVLGPKALWNPFHYDDPKLTTLFDQLQKSDEESRGEIARRINEYVVAQAWFAPFYRKDIVFVTDSKTTVKLGAGIYPDIYDFAPKS